MKRSIIKRILKIVLVVQIIVVATSFKDYLNIDDYFDDEFNIDSVFTNARYMEAYMWGQPPCFPTNQIPFVMAIPRDLWLPMRALTGLPEADRPTFTTEWVSLPGISARIFSVAGPPPNIISTNGAGITRSSGNAIPSCKTLIVPTT